MQFNVAQHIYISDCSTPKIGVSIGEVLLSVVYTLFTSYDI